MQCIWLAIGFGRQDVHYLFLYPGAIQDGLQVVMIGDICQLLLHSIVPVDEPDQGE
jgi:hypothetical protein